MIISSLSKSTKIISIKEKKTTYFYVMYYSYGLNMFFVAQVLVNFGISPFSKLYSNLVIHL